VGRPSPEGEEPLEEEYSQVLDPVRYRIVAARARAWTDALVAAGLARVESPTYVVRGVAALAADARRDRFAGRVLTARQLAGTYGVTDVDRSRPDGRGVVADHGWDEQPPAVIAAYR